MPESLKPRKGYTLKCAVTVGQKPVARFSGDGRHLAVGTADGAVQLFDWESLARGSEGALRRYADHASAVNDVDFHPLLALLDDVGYKGHIGCEYKPSTTTMASLGWAERYGVRAAEEVGG